MVMDSAAFGGGKPSSSSITHSDDAFLLGATCGTKHNAGLAFHTVSDNAAGAMIARGSQSVNCTFEAVECVARAGHRNLESLIVFVTANFTRTHGLTSINCDANVLPWGNVPALLARLRFGSCPLMLHISRQQAVAIPDW